MDLGTAPSAWGEDQVLRLHPHYYIYVLKRITAAKLQNHTEIPKCRRLSTTHQRFGAFSGTLKETPSARTLNTSCFKKRIEIQDLGLLVLHPRGCQGNLLEFTCAMVWSWTTTGEWSPVDLLSRKPSLLGVFFGVEDELMFVTPLYNIMNGRVIFLNVSINVHQL